MNLKENKLILIYLLTDLAILNFTILIAYCFGYGNITSANVYFLHGNLSWIITYWVLIKQNLYLHDNFFDRFLRILKRCIIFFIILSVLGFFTIPDFSRTFTITYVLLFFVAEIITYRILYYFLEWMRSKGKFTKRVLIVGNNETSSNLYRIIESNPMLGYKVAGFVTDEVTEAIKDYEILGEKADIENIIKDNKIQVVFVSFALLGSGGEEQKIYLKICNKQAVRLYLVPENQRWFNSVGNMETVGGLFILNPQRIPLDDIMMRIWKRSFDVLFSSAVIVLILSWLYPIVALFIKLSSKGPALFMQERTGLNNVTFKCFKFRSMKVNSESDQRQATNHDNRVTKIGNFIRKYNIDEMPQFFNVLFGQMSVVGPRPHMLKHTEEYSKLIEYYQVRHYVKPGITGWAQVNGLRGETTELWKMEQRVKYDMDYVETWTFWKDIKIIWLTVFGRKTYMNAY